MGHVLYCCNQQWGLTRLLEDQKPFLEKVYNFKIDPLSMVPKDIIIEQDIIGLCDTSSNNHTPVGIAGSRGRGIRSMVEDLSIQRLVVLFSRPKYTLEDYFTGEELFDLEEFSSPDERTNYILIGKINPLLLVNKRGDTCKETIAFQMNGKRIHVGVNDIMYPYSFTELPDGRHLVSKHDGKTYELETGRELLISKFAEKIPKNVPIVNKKEFKQADIENPKAICYAHDKIYVLSTYSSEYCRRPGFTQNIAGVFGLDERLEKVLVFDEKTQTNRICFNKLICVDDVPYAAFSEGGGTNAVFVAYDLDNPGTLKFGKCPDGDRKIPPNFRLPYTGTNIALKSKKLIAELYGQARVFAAQREQEEQTIIDTMHKLKDDRVKEMLTKNLGLIINSFDYKERIRIYNSFLKMDN